MGWLLLAGSVALEVVATLLLPASRGLTHVWWSAAVLAGYLGNIVLFAQAVHPDRASSLSIPVAYAVWAGATAVLIAAIAWRETGVSAVGVVCVGLITLGVVGLQATGTH